jgi:hypothetical protein
LQAAKDFVKKQHKGCICYADNGNGKSRYKDDYNCAVVYGGLNRKKYPFCVQWNETEMGGNI